jgi:YecR-like lipoprotein
MTTLFARGLSVAALFIALSGCATEKYLQATGGSRSDGTVDMSYEYGIFEKPQLHLAEAAETARQRCAAWGYTGAEMFGGQKEECQVRDGYGNCLRFFVTISYQCTGRPEATNSQH